MREVKRAYVKAESTLSTWFPSPISMGVSMMYLQMVGRPLPEDSRARKGVSSELHQRQWRR